MARFSADGQDYTYALALGAQANLTVCGWFKISTDRNDYSSIFFIDNGTSDNWGMQTGADGTTMASVFDASTQQGIGSMTVGTWYFICLSTAGTTGNIYYRTAASPTLTTVAVTSVTASVNAATLRIGESPWGAEWWNGCANAVKVYTAAITAADAQQESVQYAPVRTANLAAFYPLVRPETTDYSGNARTLSGGAGATREDGPPIPWRATSPRFVHIPSAGGATQNASGSLTASGTLTGSGSTDKPASASLTGTGTIAGAATSTKPATTSLTATATATASAATDKPATATLTATGTLTGAAAATKPADTSLTGTGGITAAATSDKPAAATLTAVGSITADATIGSTTQTAAGSLTGTGTVTAAAAAAKPIDTALTAAGSTTAAATGTRPGGSSLTAAGSLTSSATATKPSTASLSAIGTLTADATVGAAPITAAASLTAAGAVTPKATRTASLIATPTAIGAITATAAVTKPLAATLVGVVGCTADGTQTVNAGAALTGSAQVVAAADIPPPVVRGSMSSHTRPGPHMAGADRTPPTLTGHARPGPTMTEVT